MNNKFTKAVLLNHAVMMTALSHALEEAGKPLQGFALSAMTRRPSDLDKIAEGETAKIEEAILVDQALILGAVAHLSEGIDRSMLLLTASGTLAQLKEEYGFDPANEVRRDVTAEPATATETEAA